MENLPVAKPQVRFRFPRIRSLFLLSKKKLLIVLLISLPVIFAILLVTFIYLSGTGRDLTDETTGLPASGSERQIKNPRIVPTPDPFRNWGTYTNLLAGYEIGYPPEMVVRNAEVHKDPANVGEKTFFINIIRLDEIDGYRFHKVGIKPVKIVKDFDYEGWLNNFRDWPLTDKKEATIKIAGTEMLVVEGTGVDGERKLYYKVYAFKNVRGDYAVAILTQNPEEESDRSVFDKIVSTLELLDTTPSPSPSSVPAGGSAYPEGFSPGDF